MDRREYSLQVFDSFDSKTMIGTLDGVEIHCHYEVCDVCNGKGTHVNPSIDSHGITAEEFYDDPDFADSYFAGHYDMRCNECNGNNVVPMPDDNDPNIALYDEYVQDRAAYAEECAMERRMGC